ncbi:hypothetical protein M413DRAFT_438666 [Hebeloma cylindrosporum]|uniref:Uncharacterized protein n=1 Tax=Hebeloma cylindrosporum TaxID=76867 RepID=A0A0C2Z8M1_HEBCY|nr:hypothetical protein M413DRAFT_438666 [Hebeloma cylindrosporum h7]
MAHNTSIVTDSGPSVQPSVRSPARDRDCHAFSPVPSSLRQTNSSPSPAPFTILPSIASPSTSTGVTSQSTTAETLLKQHATSADPKAAALEQAVANRNALSGENSQLWRLIDKQKAVHNQMLKELERIRKERDFYKGKLVTLDAFPSASKQLKPVSEHGSRPNDASSKDNLSSLAPPHLQARQNSADQPNRYQPPKGPLHGSRKHPRARFERWAPNSTILEETDQTA